MSRPRGPGSDYARGTDVGSSVIPTPRDLCRNPDVTCKHIPTAHGVYSVTDKSTGPCRSCGCQEYMR